MVTCRLVTVATRRPIWVVLPAVLEEFLLIDTCLPLLLDTSKEKGRQDVGQPRKGEVIVIAPGVRRRGARRLAGAHGLDKHKAILRDALPRNSVETCRLQTGRPRLLALPASPRRAVRDQRVGHPVIAERGAPPCLSYTETLQD